MDFRTSDQIQEDTSLLHTGRVSCGLPQTVNPPIQRGSTVVVKSVDELLHSKGVTYGRHGLATHEALCTALCELEHSEKAFVYPSGLASLTGTMLSLLETGDELLMADTVYGPTRHFATVALKRLGISVRFFPASVPADQLEAMLSTKTKLIVLESPGSLTFDMSDVPGIAAMARRNSVLTMIDNTWSGGIYFKPLDHGVDVSIQAITKYICGHSDVLMGAAMASGKAAELLQRSYDEMGWTVSPDDAYQALRGFRTLPTRLARHAESTLKVANWLKSRPEVADVLCPALPGAPGHEIWKRDFTGTSGLFGFVLNPASDEAVAAMLGALKIFGLGYSWGGYESLIIPCDPQLPVREFLPAYKGPVIRIHVGLENPEDLITDLTNGFRHLAAHAKAPQAAAAE